MDADYRGNVGVVLFNFGDADFAMAAGDRVAQLILQRVDMAAAAAARAEVHEDRRDSHSPSPRGSRLKSGIK